MKKVLLTTAMLLTLSVSCFAKGPMWYDKSSTFGMAKKFVLFPIEGKCNYDGANDALYDDVQKRLGKGVVVIKLQKNGQEGIVMQQNQHHQYLLETYFSNEIERGAAVKEHANSEYYLVPRVRENEVEEEWSPRHTETIELASYTEEVGGPDGYKKYNESKRYETHTVPGKTLYLRKLNLDYIVYNSKGQKVLMYQNQEAGYNKTEEEDFKSLLREFAAVFRDGKKGCAGKK